MLAFLAAGVIVQVGDLVGAQAPSLAMEAMNARPMPRMAFGRVAQAA
jgi:hypothetical protein